MLIVRTPPPRPVVRTAVSRFAEARPPEWRRIHDVADLCRPLLERAFLSSCEEFYADVDERSLVSAIRRQDAPAAVESLPWSTLESQLLRVKDVLRAAFLGGAQVAGQYMRVLPEEPAQAAEKDPTIAVMSMLGPKIKGYFDLLNPCAVEWLEQHATELIKDDILEAAKQQIAERLKEEFLEGYGPAAMARKILPLVPLTQLHSAAAANYHQGLLAKGMDPDRADRLYQAYALRLRRWRARTIARTETIRASNAGQAEMWRLAGEQGFLDRSQTKRRWIVTPDDRLCPVCKLMRGQEVPVDKPFTGPEGTAYAGMAIENPPLHPQCRCGQGLVSPKAPALPASPTPLPAAAIAVGSPAWLDSLTEIAMGLGGIHEKHVYLDRDGRKWLFKPDEVAGIAERAAYELMREIGLPAPEVYLVTKGGKTGAIQRMFDDVDQPVRIDALHTLGKEQLEQIQAHQVADWFFGQHDSNDGAFLISKTGRAYAVDKGQACKFLGSDKLDWTYNPNPLPVVYNRLFEDHIAGLITLERSAIEPILRRVQALSPDRVRAIFMPYAERGVRTGAFRTTDEFLDRLIARKRSIAADFDDLYERANAARARRLGLATPKGAYTRLDDQFTREVREYGWAGKSIMVAGPDFEDAHVLAYEIRQGSKRTLVLEAKIRETAEGRILQAMGTPAAAGPRNHPLDDVWPEVLTTIKHVHYHLKPGSPGKDDVLKADKVKAIKDATAKLVSKAGQIGAGDQAAKDMLAHYANMIEQMTGKQLMQVHSASVAELTDWLKASYNPNLYADQYQIPVRPASVQNPDRIQSRRERPWQFARTLQNGEIVATGARETLSGETGYTLELGGGMTGVYIQHGDDNRYSKMGRLTVYRDGYQGSAREVADSLDQFKRLGLEAKLATKADLEVLYLHKQAHAMKIENDAGWRDAVVQSEARLTVDESLEVLKGFFRKKLKLKASQRLEDLPGYDPDPQFDAAWNPAGGLKGSARAGRPYWNRFDIESATFETEMSDYGLTHSLSARDTHDFLKGVLEGNGWLSNTEERLRIGAYTGQGMSPEADMGTGGANYTFTRIMKRSSWGSYNLVFDPKLLLRTDIISYNSDMYGRSDPQTKQRRNVTLKEWQAASRHGSNEAIIKNGMSLIGSLVQINSQGRRREILDLFKAHGVTEINGRKVEEVVK